MIERLRVRILAGAAGEFSSLELTLCANSCYVFVSVIVSEIVFEMCLAGAPLNKHRD